MKTKSHHDDQSVLDCNDGRVAESRNKLPVERKRCRTTVLQKLFLGAVVFGAACVCGLSQTASASPDEAPMSVSGTPGVATRRAVVNFSELARQEALALAKSPPSVFNGWSGGPAGRFHSSDATQPLHAGQPAGLSVPEATNGKDSGPSGNGGPTTDGPLGSLTDSPPPASSFPAFAYDGPISTPDTQGAVGPNHLMVTLNQIVMIQDRTGQVLSSVTPSNFWGSLGPFPVIVPPYAQIFDPRVLYDPYAARWIFTDLVNGSFNIILVGVSTTSDPTGDWSLYRFDLPFNDPLCDHPSLGFSQHWIAYQLNMFAASGDFERSDVMVFNKTNFYAGGVGSYTYFTNAVNSQSQVPATTFDNSLSTMYLLGEVGSGGTSLNSVRIYTITGPIGAEVFSVGPTVTISNRWSSGNNQNLAPQLGSTQKINIHAGRISALVYRNGSLWATHHIRLPAGNSAKRSAVQWWQLTPGGEILQRGLIEDPTDVNWYGYPSIAVNKFNDVLIGYNRYSTNQYASANYSFRAGTDPTNTLRADAVFKPGEAPFTRVADNNLIRWGDYSATRVDPVNDLDLWTIQEYAATPTNQTSRWGTWWGRVSPIRVLAVEITGVDVLIRFTTGADQTYRVERTDNLATQIVWEPVSGLTNVAGTGNAVAVLDTGAANQPQRFYRVRLN